MENDARLPHHAQKTAKQINKTALGAESSIDWSRLADLDQLNELIIELKQNNYVVAGLEQNTNSIFINEFAPPQKLAIILGSEVDGIQPELIAKCDVLIEIPMKGKKESFNVVEAASMALFYCLYG
jgi:tRNA G18 (ribose-2'-O)-methylase SpoU